MLTNRIPASEYQRRWTAAQKICSEQGLDALLVWGKGGGTIDTAFDLIYLSNYCPVFPYIADLRGAWSGISHAAVIIPAIGEPILVTETDILRRDVIAIKDIRVAAGFLPDTVAETLKQIGLSSKKIGLVAGPSLVAATFLRLLDVAKDAQFVETDWAIESLRNIKSPIEFELLREASAVGNDAMLAMMKSASTAGTTEADAVAAAYNIVIRRGTALIDAACASGPHTRYYSYGMAPQWTTRTLQEGDIFHCDMYGAAVEGYVWDFSRSVVAGGKWSAEQNEVYDAAIAAIEAGVNACRPGITASDLYQAVYQVLDERGVFCGYPIHGHSFGIGWGGPWLIPANMMKVEAGMAIAIECMAGRDDVGYVKFEHNVLVHETHTELLSTCPARL